MNTVDLKKNTKEELIIYIEKLSRDMVTIQQENLELRRDCQQQESRIQFLENIIYMYENNHKNI
jgi:16S rRNA G966 N2-methylase RsmD